MDVQEKIILKTTRVEKRPAYPGEPGVSMLKASLRALRHRKLETLAVVIVVAVGVLGLATIRLAATYSIGLAGKAWVYEAGNIVVDGRIPEEAVDAVSSLPGVEEVKLIDLVTTVAWLDGTPISVALIHNPSPSYPFSYIADQPGDVMVYDVGEPQPVEPGDTLSVPGYGDLKVGGRARGVARIAGGIDAVLLVPRGVVESVQGQHIQVLSIVAPEATDLEGLASRVEEAVAAAGGSVRNVMIQTEEDNPATKPMSSMARAFEIFVSVALIAAALLMAGSEASLLERNVRELGVLKAVGVDAWRTAAYYAGHNVVRGLVGTLIGLALSIPLSEKLVEWGARQAHGSAMEILMERYPYSPDPQALLWAGGFALILVAAGSLIPPLLAYRIPAARALRFTGLTGPAGIAVLRGKARLAYAVRRALSRPWRAAFLVLFLAITWGAAASIPMSVRGIDVIGEEIAMYGYDASIVVVLEGRDPSTLPGVALRVGGVEAAEIWAFEWRAATLGGDEVTVASCLEGSWSLGPVLARGRWPGPGEAAITETLSRLHGLDLGDEVVLSFGRGELRLRVVGIARTHNNDGLLVYVSREDYLSVLDTDFVLLRIRASGDPEEVAARVKAALVAGGVPASIAGTKEGMLESHRNNLRFVRMFLTIINAATLVVGLLGLAVLVVVDLAGRLREIGVLRALGLTDGELGLAVAGEVLVAALVAAPLAYLAGLAISSSMLDMMMGAMGYVRPLPRLSDLASSGWVLGPALLASYAACLLYLRRQPTSSLLRVE